MQFIWRGFGWVVPVIFLALFVSSRTLFDQGRQWPWLALLTGASAVIAISGYVLNGRKKRYPPLKIKDPQAHSLFLIPIEFWAVIVPAVFISVEYVSARGEKATMGTAYVESPAVNDMYLVDYTRISKNADKGLKFGILKVISVTAEGVVTVASDATYNSESGARKDFGHSGDAESSYFSSTLLSFTRDELVKLRAHSAILSVSRE